MNEFDVLIIGAGPAGSRVAYRLAYLGYRVGVFEKHHQIGNKLCCTGIIGRECVELFDVDSSCVLQEAKSAKLFAPSGEFIRVSKDEAQAYIVDRVAFDRWMARKAQDAGADFLLSCKVTDVSISKDIVTVDVVRNGTADRYCSKVVVIANGFGSTIPSSLGLGKIKNFVLGAQCEVETKGIDEVEAYFSHAIAPGFFAWLVPIADNKARVGLAAKEKPGKYLRELVSQLVLDGKVVESEVIIQYGGIPLKPLPRTYGDRLLVVGDAAGQTKPTTGGGIYFGLLCADFAADVLHETLSTNNLSRRRLARYEKLWKEKLGRELRTEYFARSFFNRLSDKRINSIFDVVRDNNIHESLLTSSYRSFDWHGELVLDGLKRLGPWRNLFGKYLPAYLISSIKGKV
ncbi:geranylgeranyl reductase family protein [Chloroflexota bacterium]